MSQETTSNISQALLGADDKGKVAYKVDGHDVKLSFNIVRKFLVRGNTDVTDSEVAQFIGLCSANLLNPLAGDAYLVKYNNQNGPAIATLIISKDAFMKRAFVNPKYQGFRAGVIVQRGQQALELEGSFFLPDDKLVGGWAEVYAGYKFPVKSTVRLCEYNKNKSTWLSIPGTMIRKVAIAQAFREAFPSVFGGLYISEEIKQAPDEQPQPDNPGENSITPTFTPAAEGSAAAAPAPAADPEATPTPEAPKEKEPEAPANLFTV